MPPTLRPQFPHRLNPYGIYETICCVCLATIASARDEAGLKRYEDAHVCNPTRLYHLALSRFTAMNDQPAAAPAESPSRRAS